MKLQNTDFFIWNNKEYLFELKGELTGDYNHITTFTKNNRTYELLFCSDSKLYFIIKQ
jgi:hypothetical protein